MCQISLYESSCHVAHLCDLKCFNTVSLCYPHQVNSVSAREQLAQSIRDLTAALAERHASLTQALESARQKRGEALAAQVAERRSLMEHAGLMAFTQELLKETDQPCFVQAARQTHNRFSVCLTVPVRLLVEQTSDCVYVYLTFIMRQVHSETTFLRVPN